MLIPRVRAKHAIMGHGVALQVIAIVLCIVQWGILLRKFFSRYFADRGNESNAQ